MYCKFLKLIFFTQWTSYIHKDKMVHHNDMRFVLNEIFLNNHTFHFLLIIKMIIQKKQLVLIKLIFNHIGIVYVLKALLHLWNAFWMCFTVNVLNCVMDGYPIFLVIYMDYRYRYNTLFKIKRLVRISEWRYFL